MKAHGNGAPETCASNLLRTVRGEIAYDRVRGRDGALVDQPNSTAQSAADAEWVLENYEPRVEVAGIDLSTPNPGHMNTVVTIKRKEEEAE